MLTYAMYIYIHVCVYTHGQNKLKLQGIKAAFSELASKDDPKHGSLPRLGRDSAKELHIRTDQDILLGRVSVA